MKAWEEELSAAEFLVSADGGRRPPDECLKSAIGEAYYAVLHGLQTMCADCFIGEEDDLSTPSKSRLEAHRLVKHGMTQIAVPIEL